MGVAGCEMLWLHKWLWLGVDLCGCSGQ